MVQLYADQFAALPLREKTLVWHLTQAAIAGRDIFYDQKHRNALEMRRVLEAIVSHPSGIDPATLAEIQRYTKLFWINTGPYNNLTARKFVLKTDATGVVGGGEVGGECRRHVPDAAQRVRRSAADATRPDVLRPERRSERDQQDTGTPARTSSARAPTTSTPA